MKAFLTILILVGVAVAALSVRIIIKKNGTFRQTDIGDSPEMKARGIGCTMEQDQEARKQRCAIDEKTL